MFGLCIGVDANRNYDFHWGEKGASNKPCSAIYQGPHPFSESELTAIRDFILPRASDIKFFNDLHSYSQLIFHPWGYTTDPPDDLEKLVKMATEVRDESIATVPSHVVVSIVLGKQGAQSR